MQTVQNVVEDFVERYLANKTSFRFAQVWIDMFIEIVFG
jgi:hypothetical protein